MTTKLPTSVLVDRRNYDEIKEKIRAVLAQDKESGIDLETDNRNAHAGIHAYKSKSTVFDLRRQVITGLSTYTEGDDYAYYFNLFHSDEENRLTWDEVKYVLDAKNSKSLWIAHNAPFEVTMLRSVYDFRLTNYLCTLQMAVSAYNQDEYDHNSLYTIGLGDISKVLGTAAVEFANYGGRNNMTAAQFEVFNQVVSKQSKATHSYNGLVKSISYGYGLKQAVRSHFGYKMTEYADVVGKGGMMDLTGDQVVTYGAEDAFWCVKLFQVLQGMMLKSNPAALKAFLTQELPMVQIYSDTWRQGMRVNFPAVKSRRETERADYAAKLRRLKKLVKAQLPFDTQPHATLMADDKMYANLYEKYRQKIVDWTNKAETEDDFATVMEVSGAVADAWATECGGIKGDLNLSYYVTIRTIMYDLLKQKCIKFKGSVQSDGEAQGKMIDKLEGEQKKLMQLISEMTSIEQRMKLYLNPYMQLADPDTGKIYPQLSSQLNTRRMAMSYPNPQQLAKRGESTYVRGFYLPDADDEVIVSLDWSSFELVIIGELSKDAGFRQAFGQLPFGDLHTEATVNCLQVTVPELTLDIFKKLHTLTEEEINAINPKILITPDGKPLTPSKAKKYWRTEVGKGANFNYFYSGALSTVGDKLGWSPDQMWAATERYRDTFPEAEAWRTETIRKLQKDGYLTLPDGHRRVRFEATSEWAQFMLGQFTQREKLLNMQHRGLSTFGKEIVKSIQTRANNQGVNALVQGTNATCAKRSAIRIVERLKKEKLRARFMCAIHDELVFSVHRSEVVELIRIAKEVMTDHPDIFETLKLDCTASVGRTFEPWDPNKADRGQIELDEIQPGILDFKDGSKLDESGIKRVVDEYLFQ